MGRAAKKARQRSKPWDFSIMNYMLFGIGIFIIVIGYIIMITGEVDSFQSVKLAPTILLLGYTVIIPISIFYRFKK